ncbi:MAG: hypothetical protein ACTSR0_07475 [Candidatus Asgardarchaeia archaeon]
MSIALNQTFLETSDNDPAIIFIFVKRCIFYYVLEEDNSGELR